MVKNLAGSTSGLFTLSSDIITVVFYISIHVQVSSRLSVTFVITSQETIRALPTSESSP